MFMNSLVVKEFDKNHQLVTVIWKDRPAWIAKQLAELAGQADPRNSVSVFLKDNDFLEEGLDYETIEGTELKEFKKLVGKSPTTQLKHTPQLTIFRESALWAYLQSLRTEGGKALKRWINRDVLPAIRQQGAYITDNANPEMLRSKADELESLTTLNDTARIMLPIFEEAGLKPQYKALALKQLYRKGGIDLPVEGIKAEQEIYDLQAIAKEVGIYSSSSKPHAQAVNAIISQLNLDDNEKETVSFERHGHVGTTTQYTKSVIDKVKHWLNSNDYPTEIRYNNKTFKVSYKKEGSLC